MKQLYIIAVVLILNISMLSSQDKSVSQTAVSQTSGDSVQEKIPGVILKAGRINCADFTPDNVYMVSGHEEGVVQVYKNKKLVSSFVIEDKHYDSFAGIFYVAISPDGSKVAVINYNYKLYLCSVDGENKKLLEKCSFSFFSQEKAPCKVLRFIDDGNKLEAIGNFVKYIFDNDGKLVNEFNFKPTDIKGKEPTLKACGTFENGCFVVLYTKEHGSGWDFFIDTYTAENRFLKTIPLEPTKSNGRFDFSTSKNKLLVKIEKEYKKYFYEIDNYWEVKNIAYDRFPSLDEYPYLLVPKYLYLDPFSDGYIGRSDESYPYEFYVFNRLLNLTGKFKIRQGGVSVNNTFYMPDQKKYFMSYSSGSNTFEVASLEGDKEGGMKYFPDNDRLYKIEQQNLTISNDNFPEKILQNAAVNIQPFIDKSLLALPDSIYMVLQNSHIDYITQVAYSPDGQLVATASYDNTVKLWNRKGIILHTFDGFGNLGGMAFSPDGKTLAIGSKNLLIYSIGGKLLKAIKNPYSNIYDVAFTPDGKNLVTNFQGQKFLAVWNSDSIICKFEGHSKIIWSLAISPDGKTIVSGSGDGLTPIDNAIIVWDISGKIKTKIPGVTNDRVSAITFSPDGNFFVCNLDHVIKIFDKDGNYINTIDSYMQGKKGMAGIAAIDISPDSKTIAAGGFGSLVWIFNLTGNILKTISPKNGYIEALAFSPGGKTLLSGQSGKKVNEWNTDGSLRQLYEKNNVWVGDFALLKDEKTIINNTSEGIVYWDITGKVIDKKTKIGFTAISPDENWIVTSYSENISIYNKRLELVNSFKAHAFDVKGVAFTPDSRKFITTSYNGEIRIWNNDGKMVTSVMANLTSDCVYKVAVSSDNTYFATISAKELQLWDMNGNIKRTIPKPDDGDKSIILKSWPILKISPNNQYIAAYFNRLQIVIWDKLGNLVKTINPQEDNGWFTSMNFGPNSDELAVGMERNQIHIYNIDGSIKKTFLGHNDKIRETMITNNGKNLVSSSDDGTIRLWNIQSGKSIVMYALGNEYLTYTSDGYWDGSKNCGSIVPMIKGITVYSIDQFALKYNRPDILIERLQPENTELITHFKNQYKKRLRKAGFTEEQLSADMQLPVAGVANLIQTGNKVSFQVNLKDSLNSLKSYNVYVNDVPLFGAYGKTVSGKMQAVTEEIFVTNGKNKIEVSCVNSKGLESYRTLNFVDYSMPVKPDLYLLAFGVSQYQNPAYNLAYADKDAKDLTTVVDGLKDKGYANIYTKILTNEQVTPDAIKASKDFVKNAKPDDTFILFIAGHGMHDKDAEATYYYLTSNADINNLKGTAADFETIEDLLQGISPRNKLFLMDACESGEIDEEDQGQMIAAATGAGIASRGFKSTAPPKTDNGKPTTAKRSYLYQKDRYIYNDLVRRSGAIVFSSSKGGELSYERSDIENGLFTEYIMKALTTTEADKDGNGVISTDELREYVSAQVAKASGDLQHPTVDRDNIYQKFGFGLH